MVLFSCWNSSLSSNSKQVISADCQHIRHIQDMQIEASSSIILLTSSWTLVNYPRVPYDPETVLETSKLDFQFWGITYTD
ncbi:hypothetical protein CEXT_552921 [Caerostris extrusa]|uniref:Uncharacterized protein n=1 Tax=Caerostris extrusa TaxID=172846 RepID=A0AAV4VT69_CAEEX|nr:hypothetical protein CEXT_552921 [Caerostris extrusa]